MGLSPLLPQRIQACAREIFGSHGDSKLHFGVEGEEERFGERRDIGRAIDVDHKGAATAPVVLGTAPLQLVVVLQLPLASTAQILACNCPANGPNAKATPSTTQNIVAVNTLILLLTPEPCSFCDITITLS